ncbi:hypothetical protein [Bythopirellula polymerisocia]|uniref:Autotransporter-associated beta strand repeat protein n=1 Tax=Bythopirellula polymerisocia TaxID=2528003 RepID=A0A5C6D3X3_9BACT|nr:hypothetical protein [Bythopirellula polymerisocia]TWU29946.1 hypothetical protein Pla144_07270 [Bythopirellula polymerisocia]
MWPKLLLLSISITAVLAFNSEPAASVDKLWINPGTDFWFLPGNWSPGGVPPDIDKTVAINNGGTAVEHGPQSYAKSATLGQNLGDSGFISVINGGFPGELYPGVLEVGLLGTGGVTVTQDGLIEASTTTLGVGATGVGTMVVEGFGRFQTPSGANFFPLVIGQEGMGLFEVKDFATAQTGSVTLGKLAGSDGTATLGGAIATSWTIEGPLVIGEAGTGDFRYTSGQLTVAKVFNLPQPIPQPITIGAQGVLRMGLGAGFNGSGLLTSGIDNYGTLEFNYNSPSTYTLNAPLTGSGDILKDGTGVTILSNYASGFTGPMTVNAGILRLKDTSVNLGGNSIRANSGAYMDYENATVRNAVMRGTGVHYIVPGATSRLFSVSTLPSSFIYQDGIAEFDNVTLGGFLQSNNVASLDGGWNTSSGQIEINSDMNIQDFTSDGVILVNNGATLNNTVSNLTAGGGSRTTIASGGTLNILGATAMELNGALLVNNGDITGTVNVNYGSLAKGSGNYDIVNVNTGGIYSPGNSPGTVTAASLSFDNTSSVGSSRLLIELGGVAQGTQYDHVNVTGLLSLGGELDISLLPGFSPSAGSSFDILDWGTLNGTFSILTLPSLGAGLSWNTSQLYSTGVLSVASALSADFDHDGDVDGHDFLVWQRGGSPNGINSGDLALWQGQYDTPLTAPATAVPEPACVSLLAFVAIYVCRRFR